MKTTYTHRDFILEEEVSLFINDGKTSLSLIQKNIGDTCILNFSEQSLECLWDWYKEILDNEKTISSNDFSPSWHNPGIKSYKSAVDLSSLNLSSIQSIDGISYYLFVMIKKLIGIEWDIFNPKGEYFDEGIRGLVFHYKGYSIEDSVGQNFTKMVVAKTMRYLEIDPNEKNPLLSIYTFQKGNVEIIKSEK